MVAWQFSTLLLLGLRALSVSAAEKAEPFAEVIEDVEEIDQTPNLKVVISSSFPQSEIFGVKLINGHATQAVLDISNEEPNPVSVAIIGGSLIKDGGADSQILRNLSSTRYSIDIPAGASESVTYSFSTEMHPQDVRLQLVAVLKDHKDGLYTLSAFNETVTVVEAPTSIFDPQIIFLYAVLLSVFAGTVYFVYNTWIATLLPQKKGRGKGGERAKRSTAGTKKVEPAEQVAVEGADGPAVTSGSKTYDASWIPAQHLQRPEAKRVRSGTPKSRVKS